MGKRIVRKFSVQATLRPNFPAIFKSRDCLYIRALTFEPTFQTPANLFSTSQDGYLFLHTYTPISGEGQRL